MVEDSIMQTDPVSKQDNHVPKQDNHVPKQDHGGRLLSVLMSILYMVALAWVCAWVLGLGWGLINYLQTFGTYNAAQPFPYFDPSPIPDQMYRYYDRGTLGGTIEDWINWNNAYFRGATRFGSGLGFIIGAIFAATTFRFKHEQDRLPVVLLAGFFVGVRFVLMIVSAPVSAALGGLGGALVALLLTAIYVRDTRVPQLPRLQLGLSCASAASATLSASVESSGEVATDGIIRRPSPVKETDGAC